MNKKFTKIQTKRKQEVKCNLHFTKLAAQDILELFTAREELNSLPRLPLSYYNTLYSYSHFSLQIGDAILILKITSSYSPSV